MFHYYRLVIISFTLLSFCFSLICFFYIRYPLCAHSLIIRLTSCLFPCFQHAPPLAFHLVSRLTLISLPVFYHFSAYSYPLRVTHCSSFLCVCRQNVSFHQLSSPSQKVHERLKELEQEVSGGATAVVALILNNKLYIANVGTDTRTHTLTHTLSHLTEVIGELFSSVGQHC